MHSHEIKEVKTEVKESKAEYKKILPAEKEGLAAALSSTFARVCSSNGSAIQITKPLENLISDYVMIADHVQYVEKELKYDPEQVAEFCLSLLSQDKQNGVGLLLDRLPKGKRDELIAVWEKSYPLLCGYYLRPREWKQKKSFIDSSLQVEFTKLKETQNSQPWIKALMHCLDIKMEIYHQGHLSMESLLNKMKQSTLHMNLSGFFLRQIRFENLDFSFVNFNGTQWLDVARFINCNVSEASFCYAQIYNGEFIGQECKLIGADFSGASISNVNFSEADLRNITLPLDGRFSLKGCVFYRSILDDSVKKQIIKFISILPPEIHPLLDVAQNPRPLPSKSFFKPKSEMNYYDCAFMVRLLGCPQAIILQAEIPENLSPQFNAEVLRYREKIQIYKSAKPKR